MLATEIVTTMHVFQGVTAPQVVAPPPVPKSQGVTYDYFNIARIMGYCGVSKI